MENNSTSPKIEYTFTDSALDRLAQDLTGNIGTGFRYLAQAYTSSGLCVVMKSVSGVLKKAMVYHYKCTG